MQLPATTLSSFSRGGFYIDSRRMPQRLSPSHPQNFTIRNFHSCPNRKIEQAQQKLNRSKGKTMSSTFLWEAEGDRNAQANTMEITGIVNKKNIVLKLKHKVRDWSDPIPNLLSIEESVHEGEVSFRRRMGLMARGNGNMLVRLEKGLHIDRRDYLKDLALQTRRRRSYLLPPHTQPHHQ